MKHLCEHCRAIPWDLIETWRYEKKFWTTLRATDESAEVLEDSRMVVDVHKMISPTCDLCQVAKNLYNQETFVYLRYEPAQNDSVFHGSLHVGIEDPSSYWLQRTFGVISGSQQPPSQAYVNFEILRAPIEWSIGASSQKGSRQDSKPVAVQGLHLIDCVQEIVLPAPEGCDYLALSYVWGSSTDNGVRRELPKLPSRLPRTIQDAITATKALGYRYLWVDRYCIDQVDDQIKHQQIQQMWDIYASAHLTIIAANGDGPDQGLAGMSLPRSSSLLRDVSIQVQGLTLVPRYVRTTNEVGSSTWASRAWTFQENFASRRRLYFSDSLAFYIEDDYFASDICPPHDLVFEVGNQNLREALERSLASQTTDTGALRDNKQTQARKCIEAYCMRNLTYDSDALNGILGVLNHFSQDQVAPAHHIWGVVVAPVDLNGPFGRRFPECYEVSIHWYHPEPGVRRKDFPSWAPIAWRGPVRHVVDASRPHIVPMIPSDYAIDVHCEGGLQPIEAYVTSGQIRHDSGRQDAPRHLTFKQVRTLSVAIDWGDSTFPAVLQIDDTTDVVLPVFWDQSVAREDVRALIGMVITTYQHGDISIMLLKPMGAHYERVGLIIWGYRTGHYTVRDCRTGVQKLARSAIDRLMSRPLFASETRQDIVLE
ncbi:uncharacterized protein EKO05_0003242 [Ascochyta rabiei]|uniref:Uncharacterized protein n=1 Tax=Didymella rabiei TaxID=5454 RepID=A0A163I9S4_DIDRA|nr:uncharacterized protein EKO05_0003242 [Ascochyta rabiei]KZM25663.1 hypothetical protein ST47_g3187 [Ascochyta rabiei]UPX12703.1 hypothetical protein EKO05_0003242 [Ascochyta rabiei]